MINSVTNDPAPSLHPRSADLIKHLRNDVIPPAEKDSTLKVYVGGQTAIFDDFAEMLTGKLPLFLMVIVALGCVLLLVAFRSLLVPLTAAVMNILATAASFGVIVAFFQYGWGSEPLGWGAAGPVEAFLPVIMLSVLFRLSMDYQVFLVSRMHEEWIHTRQPDGRGAGTVRGHPTVCVTGRGRLGPADPGRGAFGRDSGGTGVGASMNPGPLEGVRAGT